MSDTGAEFIKWLSERFSFEDPDDGLMIYPTENGGIFAMKPDGSKYITATSLTELMAKYDAGEWNAQ